MNRGKPEKYLFEVLVYLYLQQKKVHFLRMVMIDYLYLTLQSLE